MADLLEHLAVTPHASDGAAAWAASGAMALTGRRDGSPLLAAASAAPLMAALAKRFGALTAELESPVELDGPALLGERAAIAGHSRQGDVSCGGACRLLRATDGWIALSLPRDDDRALLPAWLERDVRTDQDLTEGVAARSSAVLVERAALLGLPCGALGEVREPKLPALLLAEGDRVTSLSSLTVVDLSSLWAGPLCAQLLAEAGAQVIKVESTRRPDGARLGPADFYDLLHSGTKSVVLDFTSPEGRAALAELIARADVVIEASRPRALEQLGIDARAGGARVWLSITGYGREQAARVGFGDDAAVAGGLVAWDANGPVFAADAAADPAAGLLAAVAVLDRLRAGGRWLVDVSLAGAAALLASSGRDDSGWDGPVAAPRARPPRGRAPRLGEHTDEVLASLRLRF